MPTLKMSFAKGNNIDSNKGIPLITLTIKGKAFNFVVDTGAEASVFSYKLIPILNRQQELFTRECVSYGFGGKETSKEIPIRFSLLGVQITKMVFATSIDMLSENGLNAIGIIGNDILQQFSSVTFDYKLSLVRFNI